jgi:hypothetical protein
MKEKIHTKHRSGPTQGKRRNLAVAQHHTIQKQFLAEENFLHRREMIMNRVRADWQQQTKTQSPTVATEISGGESGSSQHTLLTVNKKTTTLDFTDARGTVALWWWN